MWSEGEKEGRKQKMGEGKREGWREDRERGDLTEVLYDKGPMNNMLKNITKPHRRVHGLSQERRTGAPYLIPLSINQVHL